MPSLELLPSALRAALTNALNVSLRDAALLQGGMINHAARVDTTDGPLFVKWRDDTPPGFFAAEADGLNRLRATQTLRVPVVRAWQERGEDGTPAFLALEYIAVQEPPDPLRFAHAFGEGLAALHQDSVSPFGGFGLETDNYLGAQPQINTPHSTWPEFFRDCRLLPQIAVARQQGLFPLERERLLLRVLEKLETLLADFPARPVLLHGDLWSGNFLPAGAAPVLIDPAVSYSEREIEIAYMELFGGFPSEILAAYRSAYPLDAGYTRRRPLHQLYHLLIHLNHFGEMYSPDVERVCRLYVR